ncbi:MAG TPA: hypothetical protein GXZ23_08220 [Clostridiales bacterium]|nr:hypothetical protein [Clostridiales bacterium]
MSYCVNCGVELAKSAQKCVLCSCPVVNPMLPQDAQEDEVKPFPDLIVIPKTARKRYTALIITFLLCIPNIICGLTNIFLPETGIWSVYVILTSFLGWSMFILPFLIKKKKPYILLAVNTVYLLVYLYVLFAINLPDGSKWFLRLALPLVLLLSAMVLFMIIWLRRKQRSDFAITIAVLTEISIYCIIFDILIHVFYVIDSRVYFSFIVAASNLVITVMMIFALKNKRFGNWLRRKFFV